MTPAQLIHMQEKGKICISFIISLQHILPDNGTVALQVKKAIEKTGSLLEGMFPLKEMKTIMKRLEKLTGDIKHECNQQGIGIYITHEGPGTLVQFPFAVKDKLHIGESFWIRELLYLDYYKVEYYVLEISQKITRLYKGKLNNIQEVHDNRFPHVMEENEYATPVLNYAINNNIIEKDKPTLQHNRMKTALLAIDHKLSHYLGEYPLVVAGPEKQLLLFNNITNHWTHIVGNVTGNFRNEPLSVLEENVWPEIKDWLNRRKEVVANEWLEKRALHKICGIRDIWRVAVAGRGKILLVEKDYSLPAFQDVAGGGIHLKPPHTAIRIISDAVDEIMKIVLEEKGEVIILENGSLPNYQHMVLLAE